jgi:hypothetical protein
MPTIETEETVKVSIDVEVYCNTCGCGLCNETTVRGHQYPQFHVNACPDCMQNKDNEIDILMAEIKELNDKLSQYE